MAVTKDMLLAELQDLLRMTAFEQTIANVRRVQAASTEVAEELKANAIKAGERRQLLADAVRQTGGVPDVVGAALGKAGAFLQTQVNQVQTLQGALLGDLALEHSLRERARYARTLAESLEHTQVLPVLDRLETAHTATIKWLETRLSEVGRTGTSALRATPVQAAVATTRRTVGVPFALFAGSVNRVSTLLAGGAKRGAVAASDAVSSVSSAASGAVDSASGAVSSASSAASGAVDSAVSTVEAAVEDVAEQAQDVASQAKEAAQDAVQEAQEAQEQDSVLDLTGVDPEQEPFAAFSTLTGDSIIRHVNDNDDVEHLREILAYEQAHKARKGVLQAAEARLEALSSDA